MNKHHIHNSTAIINLKYNRQSLSYLVYQYLVYNIWFFVFLNKRSDISSFIGIHVTHIYKFYFCTFKRVEKPSIFNNKLLNSI